MEYLLGALVAILALLGFKKFKPKNLPENLSDEREKNLENKLDDLDKAEEKLQNEGVEDLNSEDVQNYWKNK